MTTPNGATGDAKVGNTRRPSQAKNWVFTLNNYTESDIEHLIDAFGAKLTRYVFQEELGEEGTPHLQGAVSFKKKMRMNECKLFNKKIHWEIMRGKPSEAYAYCCKEDTRNGELFTNFYKPLKLITYDMLLPKQVEVVNLVNRTTDDRSVLWFWEDQGNWGKSFLTRYFLDSMDAFVVNGKGKDILYGIFAFIESNGYCPPLVIIDIPRINMGKVSYGAIESLKNGYFFNAKYESGMVRFSPPSVVVFSNEAPELDSLSMDRWVVRNLVPGGEQVEGVSPSTEGELAIIENTIIAPSPSPEEETRDETIVRF